MIFKPSLILGAAIGIAIFLTTPAAADPSPPAAQATPASGSGSASQTAPSAPAASPTGSGAKVAPLADKLLTQACEVLGSAKAFSFHAEINFDHVLPSAVKVQFAGEMDFVLQRPGDLAVVYQSDIGAKQLWFRNGALTIFDPPHMVYATATVPPTIDGMLEHAADVNHVTVPLSDLAYSDPCARIKPQMVYGGYVGLNDVNGIACDHLAFSSSTVDFQLWLQHVGKPIPRKVVINYRTRLGAPEYIAVLSNWKFPDSIPDGLFRPKLPSKATRIDFVKIKEAKP